MFATGLLCCRMKMYFMLASLIVSLHITYNVNVMVSCICYCFTLTLKCYKKMWQSSYRKLTQPYLAHVLVKIVLHFMSFQDQLSVNEMYL